MDRTELEALVKEAVRDADLHAAEIPAIDLYVDQITSLTSDKLKEGADRFHDRVLTKTMINNYSKDGLISPIKGKKYSKEQILQMLLVYSMKNTLSINEIKQVLQGVYALPSYNTGMLEDVYEHFLNIKDSERNEAWETVQAFIDTHGFDVDDDSDFFTLILGMAALSSYFKCIAQALLESRYPSVDLESKEEQKRQKEEEKKEKKEKKEEKKAAKSKKDDAHEEDAQ
jgi:hypothetical protein